MFGVCVTLRPRKDDGWIVYVDGEEEWSLHELECFCYVKSQDVAD